MYVENALNWLHYERNTYYKMVITIALGVINEGVSSFTLAQLIPLPLDVSIDFKVKISCKDIVLECALFLRMVHLVLLLELHVESIGVLIEYLLESRK